MKPDDDPFFIFGEWAEAHGYDLDNAIQCATAVEHYGLRTEVEALRELAQAAEWAYVGNSCPVCFWDKAQGHAPHCEYTKARAAGYLAEEARP